MLCLFARPASAGVADIISFLKTISSTLQNGIGDVLTKKKRYDEALEIYRKSLAIREKLATPDPENARWQEDIALVYDRLGFTFSVAGRARVQPPPCPFSDST